MEGFKSFVSGGFGGMCLVFVGHPLDLIKVRLQTSTEYTGMLDCAKKTIARDGPQGLYRGILPPIVSISPIFAVYFWGYDQGKLLWKNTVGVVPETGDISTAGVLFAGGFSAIPGSAVMVPGERIKVLMQIQGQGGAAPKYSGMLDCVQQVVKEEGLAGLYKGTGLTLFRDVPGSVAYYGAYEIFKRALAPSDGSTAGPANILACGGMAGCANWVVALPADVLKSRFQTAPAGTYSGMRDVLTQLLEKEGPSALFKGLAPAMARAFPANAACFMGLEVAKKILNQWLP